MVSDAIKDAFKQFLVSVLTAPFVWAGSIIYGPAILEMTSTFNADWFRHYWYLVLLSLALGLLQFIFLWRSKNLARDLTASILIWCAFLAIYSWRKVVGPEIAPNLPLLTFFMLYCMMVAQLIAVSIFAGVKIVRFSLPLIRPGTR